MVHFGNVADLFLMIFVVKIKDNRVGLPAINARTIVIIRNLASPARIARASSGLEPDVFLLTLRAYLRKVVGGPGIAPSRSWSQTKRGHLLPRLRFEKWRL